MNKPMEILIEEWSEIMKVPEVREEYCVSFGDSPESFASKIYGSKYAFESKRRGYSGELYMIYNDTVSNKAFCLIRHKRGFEVMR
jgi:hypothetical protein